MNFLTDISEQLTNLPHWIMVMVGLVLFGVYWKKSQWPNKWLPFVNLILPSIAYPLLHHTAGEQSLWAPIPTLALQGMFIGIASEFTHEGIVSKLKGFGMKFPDSTEEPPK